MQNEMSAGCVVRPWEFQSLGVAACRTAPMGADGDGEFQTLLDVEAGPTVPLGADGDADIDSVDCNHYYTMHVISRMI